MRTVTISSSLKFKHLIKETLVRFETLGIVGLFPNLETGVKESDIDLVYMKRLQKDHYDSIDNSEGLYVICSDGYVGTGVSIEIGYAKAKGKKIIFSETPKDLGLQALADCIIPIDKLGEVKSY